MAYRDWLANLSHRLVPQGVQWNPRPRRYEPETIGLGLPVRGEASDGSRQKRPFHLLLSKRSAALAIFQIQLYHWVTWYI
jgi:hypothetical protein